MITFSSHLDGYQDVSDQMIHHLFAKASEHLRRKIARWESLTTVEEFEKHRARVRAAFLEAIGGLPEERTPLNARVTGTLKRDGYAIQKVLYESLPDFYVTALLYLPAATSPLPAVIFVHGHSDLAKAYPNYQRVCIDLVRCGFAVLAVDPPGQGERFQYLSPDTKERLVGPCTTEHTYSGLQFTLAGASLARHFIWDAMRGFDYLASRPEIDTQRVGVTGNSGGGLQTSFLMLADPRFAAAVPCTFPMTLQSYLTTGQPQDSEQIVPGCFRNGPDHHHFLTGLAPKPVMVGAVAWDFFPIEGTLEAVERARRIYRLYGKEDLVGIAIDRSRHEYSHALRQAAVNWFRVHLQGAPPDFVTGIPDVLPEEELYCTPRGQILNTYPDSLTVCDLNRDYIQKHFPTFRPIASQEDRQDRCAAMRQAIREVLGLPEGRDRPLYPRIIDEREVDGLRVEKIYFFSEPSVAVSGVLIHPPSGIFSHRTDLVLFENGTSDIPAQKERLEEKLKAGSRLFVFDVRGVGSVETRPLNPGDKNGVHGTEYRLACDAMMLGISTLGLRVFDALRGYDYLRTREDVSQIGVWGIGSGALYAFFAAALEEGFTGVVAEDMLYSYRALAEARHYNRDLYNLKIAAWGILKRFDLVDLLPCIAPRECRFLRPRDPRGDILSDEAWQMDFLQKARAGGYLDLWTDKSKLIRE